ncbi:transglutaminase family protein [Sphingobium agri]|uniref:Transglutaminase-like domain-containing protein n=1 Tax=Sphingobium agri TaxID=2933566 RepID=A0ABT0DZU0_9SPHN|nr:transglutaminase-like domain-containing protein [Sphingobium agri]MCK0532639.1 transglutaminase-like domain-containing protein [Sphingobium agri]
MNESIAYLGLLADEEIELDSAALMLSALDHEGIDVEPYLELLRGIGKAIDAERSGAGDDELQSGEAQGALLARVIGTQFGFAGDSESYDAPLNADMVRVLDRRLGLPVSLSILYVAAARRAGWRSHALNTPGHVLVSIGPEDAPAIIDPFRRGALVQAEQLSELLTRAAISGPQAQSAVEPMSNRMTLVRLLLNQATRAEDAGDTWRACTIYERMTVVAPEHDAGWWALARLQLVHGEVEAARASLCAMLEISRDPERRRYVAAALSQLSGQSQA